MLASSAAPELPHIDPDLFHDYGNNVASYSQWQAWLHQHKPQMKTRAHTFPAIVQVKSSATALTADAR